MDFLYLLLPAITMLFIFAIYGWKATIKKFGLFIVGYIVMQVPAAGRSEKQHVYSQKLGKKLFPVLLIGILIVTEIKTRWLS